MPLPTLVKSWQFSVNHALPAGNTAVETYQAILWRIKTSIIGFIDSSPWTVVGSSNSVAFSMDGTDRWLTPSNIVWANGAANHSWIVLRQDGINTNYQICIDCDNQGGQPAANLRIVISYGAGFTGGSLTARPTATDEHTIQSTGAWFGGSQTTPFLPVVHVMKTTDGQITRMIGCQGGSVVSYWNFEKPVNAVPSWAIPAVSSAANTGPGTDTTTYSRFNDTAGLFFRHGAANYAAFMTSEGFIAGMAGEQLTLQPNDVDGLFPFFPIGLVSTTVGARGRHGALTDIYWGITNTFPSGTTYPADGSKQWVQFGHLIFPWNGTNPTTA